ncbi:MAG: glycoside hydrolase family 88 protein [Prevotella sp.]|nr:glycoside hydrolase family 88 protein [Prevotella sp.]
MNNFYANTTKCGFAVYDQNGTQTSARDDGKKELDYVVGLVAKSIIEASQYYSQFTWAQSFAKPWFLSIKNYGDNFYSKFSTSGGSLDDLNAVKLFIPLRAMTATDGKYPTTTTYGYTTSALNNAIKGLKAHNDTFSIVTGTLAETAGGKNFAGGWWHKSTYQNQMWLDGAYMGAALFAELVNYSGKTTNIDSSNDWDLIVKQFTILRDMCWNETDKLPYHAFAADGGTNETSHSDTWYGLSSKSPYVFHSASYWGRAVGWYFLALVDILEQMEKANIASTDPKFTTLKSYLTETAEGLKARQDQATGGWYQILDEKSTYSASEYNNGLSHTTTYNYIESSATALFTAAYLKAIRKGYLAENDYKTVAVNGYKCLVNQFFSVDDNGNVNIFGSCRSAGLGGKGDEYKAGAIKFRDGSKPYYLLGKDVAMVKKSENITEGKVLGAFILAATEYERQYQNYPLLSEDLRSSYSLSNGKSISVEVTGNSSYTVAYQWYKYDATTSTSTVIDNATEASFKPTASGKYYCEITLTQESSSAITRAANKITYQTRTTDVEVTGTAANLYTVTFNAGSNGTCSTTSIKQASANASINLPSVTANAGYTFDGWYTAQTGGTKIGGAGETYTPTDNITLYAHYTATGGGNLLVTLPTTGTTEITCNGSAETVSSKDYVMYNEYCYKISSGKTCKLTIPSGVTVTKIEIIGTSNDNSANSTITISDCTPTNGGDLNTRKSSDGKSTLTFIPTSKQSTYTITSSNKGSLIQIKVYGTTGSSTEATPSTDASATFTYNGKALSFTDYAATIELGSSQANSKITVNATPATGATIATSSANTSIAGNVITITTPAAGSNASYAYTVTAADGKTTQTYTINVSVSSASTGETNVYSYKVKSGDTAPGINSSKYIYDDNGNKLVKMTFGGWTWEGFASKADEDAGKKTKGSYKIVRGENTKYYTDSWSAARTEGVTKLDGYDHWFVGGQDAVDESKASNGIIYGTERFGWFKTQTTDAANNVTTYPFTLPVRGAYMTFEPTENGWLTIYILQNGVWNTFNSDTKVDNVQYKKYDIKPGEFRMHSFFITNQRGLTVQDFAPDMYSYDVNQKVESGYSCSLYRSTDKPADSDMNIHGKDVSYWPEFWTLDDTEREAVYTHWANGDNGSETVIELTNGSFLLIQKAVIKYRFHVTGNETYYFFSNFSKMGFSGATFQPDNAQPTETLTLKDTEKYTAPTAGTDGKVDNVTIPQYKSITFTRTFKPNQWTTLTLPFNLTQEEVQKIFGDGTQIIMLDKATLSSDGGARLHFIYHEIQNVLPGYPYLIKPTKEVNSFTANNKCINPSIKPFKVNTTPYTFLGTPGYCTAEKSNNNNVSGYSVKYEANDIFVSEGDGKLYVSGGASYGKGYRAWLQKNKAITTPVKSISVVMSSFSDDDDTTTSIDVAEMAPDLIEALGIQTGVYNLSGQRVANDTRNLKAGIYIVNGKKTVVR